jgi:hypothetical protein
MMMIVVSFSPSPKHSVSAIEYTLLQFDTILAIDRTLWYPDNTWHCQDLYTQRLEVMVRVRILPNKHSKAWAVCWRKEI